MSIQHVAIFGKQLSSIDSITVDYKAKVKCARQCGLQRKM